LLRQLDEVDRNVFKLQLIERVAEKTDRPAYRRLQRLREELNWLYRATQKSMYNAKALDREKRSDEALAEFILSLEEIYLTVAANPKTPTGRGKNPFLALAGRHCTLCQSRNPKRHSEAIIAALRTMSGPPIEGHIHLFFLWNTARDRRGVHDYVSLRNPLSGSGESRRTFRARTVQGAGRADLRSPEAGREDGRHGSHKFYDLMNRGIIKSRKVHGMRLAEVASIKALGSAE